MLSAAADIKTDGAAHALAESEALHERVREVIAASIRGCMQGPMQGPMQGGAHLDEQGFDRLALAIAGFQARHVEPVSRLVHARGVDLERASSASIIPAVPTDVFRLARVAAHDAAHDTRVFRTSGTTSDARGEHPLRTTATYRAAAIAWGARYLFPESEDAQPARAIALAPPAAALPDSSLSFMIDAFAEHLGVPIAHHVDALRSAIDLEGLARSCAEARAEGRPALLFGTSFAFVWALDEGVGLDLHLPRGSCAMLTGGFKGKTREVDEADLRRGLAARFDLDEARVVGEYGMTELSSQLYDARLVGARNPEAYRAPPWVRVVAVDPVTLSPVAPGDEGIARIVDLANVDSAVAVQTADRVRVTEDGVLLYGRSPGATPRGCSLAVEEMRLGGAS